MITNIKYDYHSNKVRLGFSLQKLSITPGFHFEMIEGTIIEKYERSNTKYVPIGDVVTLLVFDKSNNIIGALTTNPELKDSIANTDIKTNRSLVNDIVDLVYSKVNKVSKKATLVFTGNSKKLSISISDNITYSVEESNGSVLAENRDLVSDLIKSCNVLYSLEWYSDLSIGGHRSVSVTGSQMTVYKELCNLLHNTVVLSCKDNKGNTVEVYLTTNERFAIVHESNNSYMTGMHGLEVDSLIPYSIYVTNIKKSYLRERYNISK